MGEALERVIDGQYVTRSDLDQAICELTDNTVRKLSFGKRVEFDEAHTTLSHPRVVRAVSSLADDKIRRD